MKLGTSFDEDIRDTDGYLRIDFVGELDYKEAFAELCEIREELKEVGYELDDVSCEHDCITGYVRKR